MRSVDAGKKIILVRTSFIPRLILQQTTGSGVQGSPCDVVTLLGEGCESP